MLCYKPDVCLSFVLKEIGFEVDFEEDGDVDEEDRIEIENERNEGKDYLVRCGCTITPPLKEEDGVAVPTPTFEEMVVETPGSLVVHAPVYDDDETKKSSLI